MIVVGRGVVEGGLHVNITHCVLAPVADGRGRGHPVGTGYLFLFICVLCVRLGGTESVTLVCVCVCVNSLHSRCLYVCAFAAYYSVYSCVSSVEKLAACEGAVHARVCNSLHICLLCVCVCARSFKCLC